LNIKIKLNADALGTIVRGGNLKSIWKYEIWRC